MIACTAPNDLVASCRASTGSADGAGPGGVAVLAGVAWVGRAGAPGVRCGRIGAGWPGPG